MKKLNKCTEYEVSSNWVAAYSEPNQKIARIYQYPVDCGPPRSIYLSLSQLKRIVADLERKDVPPAKDL